jgi:signal transduction histidine kinase
MALARVFAPQRISLGLQVLGVGLLVFALDFLCITLTRRMGDVAALWPTDGVVLGLMGSGRLKRPWTLLAASIFGGLAAELSSGDLPLLALGLPLANTAGIACAFLLLRKLLGEEITPEKPRRMMVFLLVTTGAALGSAVLGAGLLHLQTGGPLGENLVIWATADALGYWTLAPLVRILARRREAFEPNGLARDAGVLAGFTVILLLVFIQREYPLLFMIPLGLFAVAYVSELRGVAIAILLTSAVGTVLGGLGRGPIALVVGDSDKKLMVLQIFLATMTVSILPVAVAMAERRAISRSLVQARDLAQAEERRARNANRIVQMAEEIALVGHWHRDLADDVSVWSDQVSRLFGAELVGSRSLELALAAVHPDDRDALALALARAETEGLACTLDVRVNRQDGPRDLRVHVAAERGENGAVATVYGMALDVTQSKAAEAALTAARQVAERAAVAKAEFLADMSHEIRTPLSSILGFSHLLRELPGLSGDAARYIERIMAAGDSLLTAVGDILSLSKLEAGQVQILRQSMSPTALIDDVVQMLQPQADKKGLILQGRVEPDAPARLLADAPRLRQVLVNLAGNAIKFTAEGRVGVRLAYDREQTRMRIEVSDTGPGVPRLARLFERYVQTSLETKDGAGGVGLGLAISKGLVEAMGGCIGVSSAVGGGSLFWLEIPAPIAPPSEAASWVLIVGDLEMRLGG